MYLGINIKLLIIKYIQNIGLTRWFLYSALQWDNNGSETQFNFFMSSVK